MYYFVFDISDNDNKCILNQTELFEKKFDNSAELFSK